MSSRDSSTLYLPLGRPRLQSETFFRASYSTWTSQPLSAPACPPSPSQAACRSTAVRGVRPPGRRSARESQRESLCCRCNRNACPTGRCRRSQADRTAPTCGSLAKRCPGVALSSSSTRGPRRSVFGSAVNVGERQGRGGKEHGTVADRLRLGLWRVGDQVPGGFRFLDFPIAVVNALTGSWFLLRSWSSSATSRQLQ